MRDIDGLRSRIMQYSLLDFSKSSALISDTPSQGNRRLEERTSVQGLDYRD